MHGEGFVQEEGLKIERVHARLAVSEAEALPEPGPELHVRGGSDQDRVALEVGDGVDAVVRHQPLQVELERGRDGGDGQAVGDAAQHLDIVAHDDVGIAGHEQLHGVHLRAAHADVHVEGRLLVQAGGLGLIEAAVLGLGEPTRQESDLLRGGVGASGGDAGDGRAR